ncbi:cupredoxin domain-containing protein [Lihuaxuella thermophila]|uniref:Cupredoxin-like domain-containing protein n=1 Tax=Lihuaxuella thermophila TaxID=1173111 RepID=A0A1H8JG48_9BACL|nr:cupredoxin domain-containing protein [Lihuaxuella thermophila]SEN79276.1 Cupredoxin-like domain-containing protein [Lihuaxuella thermophila]
MTHSRQWIYFLIGLIVIALAGVAALLPAIPWFKQEPSLDKAATATVSPVRDIHLFTVEYNAKMNDKKAEAYRWDPGTIVLHKGESVRLHIHGFHGKEHPFSIPAFHLKGTVKKGQVTTVEFQPDRTGTFELICHNHLTSAAHGPMIGYITVVNP